MVRHLVKSENSGKTNRELTRSGETVEIEHDERMAYAWYDEEEETNSPSHTGSTASATTTALLLRKSYSSQSYDPLYIGPREPRELNTRRRAHSLMKGDQTYRWTLHVDLLRLRLEEGERWVEVSSCRE